MVEQRTNKTIFNLLFYSAILILASLILYYNKSYWLGFMREESFIVYKPLFNFVRLSIVALIAILFIYRKHIYRNRKKIFIGLLSLIFLVIILEVASNYILCNKLDIVMQSRLVLEGQCGFQNKYTRHAYLNHQETPMYESPDGLNIHNSYGYRGREIEVPKPKSVYRIAVIGASTVYTNEIKDWREDFARQLERELNKHYDNVEVINAGIGGATSWETLVDLEFNVIDTEPDLVITYFASNDVRMRVVEPSQYKSDNSGGRKQYEENKIPLILRPTFMRLLTKINPSSLGRSINKPPAKSFVESDNYKASIELFKENPPIYFERNLRSMVAISKVHNIDIMLSTWAHTNLLGGRVSSPYYEVGLEENNEVIRKVANELDAPLYDFVKEMPIDERYWADGLHVNEEGVELKAHLFAKFIIENKLVGR